MPMLCCVSTATPPLTSISIFNISFASGGRRISPKYRESSSATNLFSGIISEGE